MSELLSPVYSWFSIGEMQVRGAIRLFRVTDQLQQAIRTQLEFIGHFI